jgi:hypothetical protein
MVVLVVVIASSSFAQQASGARTTIEDAEPYRSEEFAPWLLTLRRAEIVAVGSIPFSMLASRLIYSLGRYAYFSISAGQSLPEYLPPLFAPPGAIPLDSDDNRSIVLGAIGLSLLIALGDYLLGLGETGADTNAQP